MFSVKTVEFYRRQSEELKKHEIEVQRLLEQKQKDEETKTQLEKTIQEKDKALQAKAQQKQVRVASAYMVAPSENESIVWSFLIQQGFNRNQTAGIMGNLQQEHNFQTSGDGLAQWIGGRKARLMAMPDPYNIHTQLNFLMVELNGGYIGVKNNLMATNDVVTATRIFQNQFERCGVCAEGQRINYAFAILGRY